MLYTLLNEGSCRHNYAAIVVLFLDCYIKAGQFRHCAQCCSSSYVNYWYFSAAPNRAIQRPLMYILTLLRSVNGTIYIILMGIQRNELGPCFQPYTPLLLPNGTFLNSTSCYVPIDQIGIRGIVGIIFSMYFALTIIFTFVNLRKHGSLITAEKRFCVLPVP